MGLLTTPIHEITFEVLKEFFDVEQIPREGLHLEFKKIWPRTDQGAPDNDKVAHAIAALANTIGGWLFIGIDEERHNGKPTGKSTWPPNWIGADSNIENTIQQIAERIYPYVPLEAEPVINPENSDEMVAVIRVNPSEIAPHYTQNKDGGAQVYVRRPVGNENVWKEDTLATQQELERMYEKRSRLEEVRKSFINRSKERALSFGIRNDNLDPYAHRPYVAKGIFCQPTIFITCLPKFPTEPLLTYDNMVSEIHRIVQDLKDSYYYGHSHISILPDSLNQRQIDSMIGYIYDKFNYTIEISRYGQISICLNPAYSKTGDPKHGIVVYAYMASSVVTCALLLSKMLKFPTQCLMYIELLNFRDRSIAVLDQGFTKITKTEIKSEIHEEISFNLGRDHILLKMEMIASKLSWALNIKDYKEDCKKKLMEFAERAFPADVEIESDEN